MSATLELLELKVISLETDRADEELGMQLGFETAKYGFNHQDLAAKGERAVRSELNSGIHGHIGLAPFTFVSTWLADAEFARLAEDSTKRDAREDETLSIAKESLSTAKDALSTAKDAALSAKAAASAATAAALEAASANKIARSNRRIAIAASIIAVIAAAIAMYAAVNGAK